MKEQKFPFLLMGLIFLSMLPVTMIVPVLKDIIKDNLLSGNMEVALFTSISMLGSFLFSPVAGIISDKLGNRNKVIAVACFLDAILFYMMTQVQNVDHLLVLRFLEGSVHIFVIGLLLSSVSDRENNPNSKFFQMGKLMGIAGMFLSLGAAIGMPLGVLGKKDPHMPFYVGSVIFIVIGIVSIFLLKDSIHSNKKDFSFSELLVSLKLNPYLVVPFAFHFIDRFTVGFLVSSFNIHMRETLDFSAGLAGGFLGLVLLPMSLLSYPSAIAAKKWGILPLVLTGSSIYGIFLAGIGWTNQFWVLFSFLIISGIGAGVMYVPSMILASRMSPKGYNGTVMSAFTGFGSLGFMTGPIASVGLENLYNNYFPTEQTFSLLSTSFGVLEIFLVLITIPLLKKMEFK
ncbi:MAG: MFS transporter [Leptospira sp.]|nr:MFS transporter [Leptospira sp.]